MTWTVAIEPLVIHPCRSRPYLEGKSSRLERTGGGNKAGRMRRSAFRATDHIVVIKSQLLKSVPAVLTLKIIQRHDKTPRKKKWKVATFFTFPVLLDKHPTPAGKVRQKVVISHPGCPEILSNDFS